MISEKKYEMKRFITLQASILMSEAQCKEFPTGSTKFQTSYMLAESYFHTKEWKKAEECFRKAMILRRFAQKAKVRAFSFPRICLIEEILKVFCFSEATRDDFKEDGHVKYLSSSAKIDGVPKELDQDCIFGCYESASSSESR